MATTKITNKAIAEMIQENVHGVDNIICKKNGTFSLRRSYFYRFSSAEKFATNITNALTKDESWSIADTNDIFQAWPKDSYYEVIIAVNNKEDFMAKFNAKPTATPEPEITIAPEPETGTVAEYESEESAGAEDLFTRFDLKKVYPDRKAFRVALRKLFADLQSEYILDHGTYTFINNGHCFAFELTPSNDLVITDLGIA